MPAKMKEVKMKRELLFSVTIALILQTNIALAQANIFDSPSIVPPSNVHIVNRAKEILHFAIRPERYTWGSFSVGPGQSRTIFCDNCSANFFEFRMKSNGHIVNYDLDSGERYTLQWNNSKRHWDIFLVQK